MPFPALIAILAAIVYFALTGLLWYERPSPGYWLLGSLILSGGYMATFFRCITAR